MNRTTATGSVDGQYVDDNPGLGVTGTLLIAADRNAIQEELVGAIEAAGLTPSASDNAQVTAAIKILALAEVTAARILERLKTVDGVDSGLDADLWRGQAPSAFQAAATAINTGNIGSQSVNYATTAGSATSAGNADTLDGAHAATTGANTVVKRGSNGEIYDRNGEEIVALRAHHQVISQSLVAGNISFTVSYAPKAITFLKIGNPSGSVTDAEISNVSISGTTVSCYYSGSNGTMAISISYLY